MKPLRSLPWITGITSFLLMLTVLSGQSETLRAKFRISVKKETYSGAPLKIAAVYPIQSHILAIQIDAEAVSHGRQLPYVPRPGDRTETDDSGNVWLLRGEEKRPEGQAIVGALVGPKKQTLRTFDHLSPPGLDPRLLSQPQTYRISGGDGPAQQPQRVYRKTQPVDMAQVGPWETAWPQSHTVYLELTEPLKPGGRYRIAIAPPTSTPKKPEEITFVYDPEHQLSEAVHVSHIGFRPQDPKVAFLSTWMGDGGGVEYSTDLKFWLVENQTQVKVHQGTVALRRAPGEAEDPRGQNYNGTWVYGLDFSPVEQTGNYRVCVETVGCSIAFAIAPDIWQAPFRLAARGFYHQRSGMALGPPHTERVRSRSFHPADGQRIYQSSASILDSGNGLDYEKDNFKALVEGKTDQSVQAWGGYFDAGDWDRRTQHLAVARLLLELAEIAPATAAVDLNLPESDNALPDLIDEALWGIDFFQRLQLPNGGIRGGIESAEHPRWGEASWQESWDVMAYGPDVWSSYIYAGVAARAAWTLDRWLAETAGSPVAASGQGEIAARSQAYRRSALAAMAYAEREREATASSDRQTLGIRDARNLAAVELLRLTGDRIWHRLFLDTTALVTPTAPLQSWDSHDQRDAAFVYLQLPPARVDAKVRRNAQRALLDEAETSIALSQGTGFGWTRMSPLDPVRWSGSFGHPKVTTLVRAHFLTKDKRYLKTALQAAQFGLGANPFNATLTTGLGQRSPQHPLVVDQRALGQPPPPGITVYGPFNWADYPESWHAQNIAAQVHPPLRLWPATEAFFDVYLFPSVTEFTVAETMAPVAYAWGYFLGHELN